MPNLTRIVCYPINEEVHGLGSVQGKVSIHQNPNQDLRLTLCKLEAKAIKEPINYAALHIPIAFQDRLELWLNCDDDSLVFNTCNQGFIDNEAFKIYILFAYECLRKATENESQYEK